MVDVKNRGAYGMRAGWVLVVSVLSAGVMSGAAWAEQWPQGAVDPQASPEQRHLPSVYEFVEERSPEHAPREAGDGKYWWKGNLHTHTLWSDGDQFPEVVTDWYYQHGYHFLTLSDHNVLSRGERWINMRSNRYVRRGGGIDAVLGPYEERFGDWVQTRTNSDGDVEARLMPLNEFRHLFERAGEFILIEAEEITESPHVVHVNATNIMEQIDPYSADTVEETIRQNVDAVVEQSEQYGQPMLPHLNHPNFRWAVTAEDMAPVENLQLFEVYNGHRGVNNLGDDTHIDLDRMWDIVLTLRLAELDLGVMYGLATDDTHNYGPEAPQTARPGRGWVMVRSAYLTPEHMIAALEAGDFYSTTGVKLDDVQADESSLSVDIDAEQGVDYTIQFIGTREGYDTSREPVMDYAQAGYLADLTDQWVFVQAVVDRQSDEQILRVYDPDQQQWHTAIEDLPAGSINPRGPLNITSHPDDYPFQGQLSQVRFWHRARTQEQALEDMNDALTGSEQGLVGYWPFTGEHPHRVRDRAGRADLTLEGGARVQAAEGAPDGEALVTDGQDAYGQVSDPAALAPGDSSFTIEMWVRTDEQASDWNLPLEWRGGDRLYVGHRVGNGWNFMVTTDGTRTDTRDGRSGEPIPVDTTQRYSDDIGQVLQESTGSSATYEFTGDEIYVRAKIISSKEKENGFADDEQEKAWIQPVVPGQ